MSEEEEEEEEVVVVVEDREEKGLVEEDDEKELMVEDLDLDGLLTGMGAMYPPRPVSVASADSSDESSVVWSFFFSSWDFFFFP